MRVIYDGHPAQQSKWNKIYWARGLYVATVGGITGFLVVF